MKKLVIVAIKYQELEWEEFTLPCIKEAAAETGADIIMVDRQGTGSLAEAVNRSFKDGSLQKEYEYALITTNVTFAGWVIKKLLKEIQEHGLVAIHPSFASDHPHLQIQAERVLVDTKAPFVEFTCPMVSVEAMTKNLLDEDMPYWGHDLDWGYRIKQSGPHLIGVSHSTIIGHTYIRNNKKQEPVTIARADMRKQTDGFTKQKIVSKYGHAWKKILMYS